MDQNLQSSGQQALARILLAAILLLCLVLLGLFDYAARARDSDLLWGSVASVLVLALPLLWLAKRVRTASTPITKSARVVSLTGVRWMLLIFLLLAVGLRLYDLGTESFWYDEVWTADWASQSLGEIWQIINPLPYMVIQLLLHIGDSEFVLRFSSALVGILTVPVVFVLGRTLFGRREGLIAAALLASSLYAIYHSQELRYYSWQILFSTLSLLFLLQGLRHNRIRDWAGFTACTILNLYNHPFALFVLASEGLYSASVLTWDLALAPTVRGRPWPIRLRTLGRRMVGPAVSAIIILALYTPQWHSLFWFYNPIWVAELDPAPASSLLDSGTSWNFGHNWLNFPVAFWIFGLSGQLLSVGTAPLLIFWLLGLLLLGLVAARGRTVLLTLLWILLPLPVLLLVGTRIYARYLSFFLPLLLVVMAKGITFLADAFTRQPRKRTVLLIAFTALAAAPSLLQLPTYYTEPQKSQWRELAALVDAEHQAGDLFLINSAYYLEPLPFDWYSTTAADDLIRQPFPEAYVLRDRAQLDDLAPLIAEYERVWLVFCRTQPEVQMLVEETMPDTLDLVDEEQFEGLRLLLFEPKSRGGSE